MRIVHGLSPLGPIFGKELRVAARRRRNYVLRVAYLGGLLLFLLLAWSITHSFRFGATSVAGRAQQQQQLGFYFFAFFSMFCGGTMALIGPVLTSTAINGERQAKTLHVLLMTPISAWQIVSGKLLSRMLTALTLIGLSLPVLALVRLLGGVELDQMFGVLCLCASVALFGAAVGLVLSIVLRRAFAVILLSYISFAILYFFTPILVAALMPRAWRNYPWWSLLNSYNPFTNIAILGWGQMRMLPVHWHVCVLYHVAATGVLLVLSAWMVRRLARHEGERIVGPVDAAPLAQISVDASAPLAPIPPPVRFRRTRSVSDYPVLWRELRRPLMTRAWQRIAAGIIIGGLLVLAYVAAAVNRALDDHGFHGFMTGCFYTLMLLITCVIAATSIAQEKEGETWHILLASPLSGSAIIWGKTLGVLRRLLWPMAMVAGHFAIFVTLGAVAPAQAVVALAVVALFNAVWVATGVALSLSFRKVTTAVIVNLMLPVALYGAGSLLLAVIDSMFDLSGHLLEQVQWYLPYAYILEAFSYRGDAARRLVSTPMSLESFAIATVLVGLAHVLIAAAIVWWTALWFDTTVARAHQRDPLPLSTSPAS
jgi:ABC-type transport system involved in multi-copper enzyme maturation permease subunit